MKIEGKRIYSTLKFSREHLPVAGETIESIGHWLLSSLFPRIDREYFESREAEQQKMTRGTENAIRRVALRTDPEFIRWYEKVEAANYFMDLGDKIIDGQELTVSDLGMARFYARNSPDFLQEFPLEALGEDRKYEKALSPYLPQIFVDDMIDPYSK